MKDEAKQEVKRGMWEDPTTRRTKIFFDTEFTGLHQATELISIGLVAESGETFYAESSAWTGNSAPKGDRDWIFANVVPTLKFFRKTHTGWLRQDTPLITEMFDNEKNIANELTKWLSQFGPVELWSDCLSYDFVLFNQLWGHAFKIPKNVYYIPFDICTMFKLRGIDPDISREEFSGMTEGAEKHNALWDAQAIKACHTKLSLNH